MSPPGHQDAFKDAPTPHPLQLVKVGRQLGRSMAQSASRPPEADSLAGLYPRARPGTVSVVLAAPSGHLFRRRRSADRIAH